MKLKKSIALFSVMVFLAFAVTACGISGTASTGTGDSSASIIESDVQDSEKEISEALEEQDAAFPEMQDTGSEETPDVQNIDSDDTLGTEHSGNVLIAYFSNTGNTEAVAQRIAEYTGGNLAEIQRTEEYGDLREEAEEEIDNGIRPDITVSVDNVEDYDVIFVGYPIWWDEAPAMISTFLTSYDFSDRVVVPFCTSASDTIDNSLHIFEELCPEAVIMEGLTANDMEDIVPWLQQLGYGAEPGSEETSG